MDTGVLKNRISRIFYGALVWAVFYYYVFYDATEWNEETLLGNDFGVRHSMALAYGIKFVFFTLVGLNLYKTTLGKSKGIFTLNRVLNVLILATLVSFILQFVLYQADIYAFKGLIGWVYNHEAPYHLDGRFLFMMVSHIVELLYMGMVVIFMFQLYKSKKTVPFMFKVRLGIIGFIYLFALSFHHFSESEFLPFLIGSIYLFIALMVYVKTQYNLALAMLALVFLVII